MLMTNDIGVLFASMRTAYGAQWKHGQEAIQVWYNALKEHEPEAVRIATNAILKTHVNFPPTLPQFIQAVTGPKKRISTYLPPTTKCDIANHDQAIREMKRLRDMPALEDPRGRNWK